MKTFIPPPPNAGFGNRFFTYVIEGTFARENDLIKIEKSYAAKLNGRVWGFDVENSAAWSRKDP